VFNCEVQIKSIILRTGRTNALYIAKLQRFCGNNELEWFVARVDSKLRPMAITMLESSAVRSQML